MEKTPTFKVQPFGDYYLLQRIAVGGMAEIFKAKQIGVRGFEKIVVIKKILQHLSEDPEFVEMFEDEAKIAAQLTQANVVQIYELGEIESTLYITMEHIDGKNLRDLTRAASQRGIHLSIEQSVYLMIEVLKGLDYAHRKTDSMSNPLSIVHRDMSPQNIIVSYEGEVKILDFGIAKAASKISRTEAGVLKGKFSYMSPEQASGKIIDQTSDVYACGVILHELLTSERLFRAKSDMETLERVKEGKVIPPSDRNPDVPPELDRVVLKALAKEQSLRYRSSGEMLSDLTRFSHEQKYNHSSQELSAFMKTLFAETISLEKEHLLRSLSQIPSNGAPNQLRNAKTHIAFKREPYGGKTEAYDSPSGRGRDKGEGTHTSHKKMASKATFLRLISVFLFLMAAAFFYFQPHPPAEESKPISNQVQEILNQPEPPNPLPRNVLDQLNDEEKPAPELPKVENKPRKEKSKVVTPKKESKKEPKKEPEKKKIKPPPKISKPPAPKPTPKVVSKPVELPSGLIDVIAPSEGFAQLFINNQSFGTVPGPKARGISLKQGRHLVRCQTSSRNYQGMIDVKGNERAQVLCQDLK